MGLTPVLDVVQSKMDLVNVRVVGGNIDHPLLYTNPACFQGIFLFAFFE